jgi:dipeptide/tripeptide permease
MSAALFYIVNSLTWSVVGFIVGSWVASSARRVQQQEAVVPNSTFLAVHGHRMTTQNATRIIGIVVLLLAIFTVVQNTRTSQRLSDVTSCQAKFNHEFAEVSTLRAALADQDRRALQDMLLALYQQRNASQDKRLRTFEAWVATTERNDRARKQNPLPELPSGECR